MNTYMNKMGILYNIMRKASYWSACWFGVGTT